MSAVHPALIAAQQRRLRVDQRGQSGGADNVDGDGSSDDPRDFGTSTQYPKLKCRMIAELTVDGTRGGYSRENTFTVN